LLKVNIEKRLGCGAGGYEKLKAHEFFAGFDWMKLAGGVLEAPIKPDRTKMNAPPSGEMDMKKVKEYAGKKHGGAFDEHFKDWDFTGANTTVAESYVGFLNKRALEAKKLEKNLDATTLFTEMSDPYSSASLADLLAKDFPKEAEKAASLTVKAKKSKGRKAKARPSKLASIDEVAAAETRADTDADATMPTIPAVCTLADIGDRLFISSAEPGRDVEPPESTIGGQTTCIVCFTNPKTHLAAPCGHQCACGTCAAKMNQCPYCRELVAMWVIQRIV